jgi:hypothetical protein
MKACSLMHWPKPPREDDPSEQLEDAAGVEEQVFQSVAAMMTEYHQPLLVASRVGPSTTGVYAAIVCFGGGLPWVTNFGP